MKNDEWEKIKQLYQAAVELAASDRASFLDLHCAGDETLRREVESLLAYQEKAEHFIEVPAIEVSARTVANDPAPSIVGIGETLSQYRVLEKLGAGGMGVVYKAEDVKLQRYVALKFLSEEFAKDRQALERFQREARAVAALDHPNICTIHDITEDAGRRFIVMQWLDGETLKQLLAAKPLSIQKLLDLAVQITDALDKVHSKDVIHRDIKPANIFITREGQAKILDFGLAKIAESRDAGEPLDTSLTNSGMTVGTLGYMSPEQALGRQLDSRTDLFSWGAVLYEMATGTAAFQGTRGAILDQIIHEKPAPPSSLNAKVPSDLERILEKLLEKAPGDRYQSAADLRSDLLDLREQTKVGRNRVRAMQPPPGSARPGIRKRLFAISLLLLAVAGVSMWATRQPELDFHERDTVMLGAISDSGGDTVLEGAIGHVLRIGLEQSSYADVLSTARMRQALSRMRKSENQVLTDDIARDICQRESAKILVTGSISHLASQYQLSVRLINCVTGDSVRTLTSTVDSPDKLVSAVDSIVKDLRMELGESLTSVAKTHRLLEKATTSSLEALKFFTEGNIRWSKGEYQAARTLFERAVELDPEFGRAYASLAVTYAAYSFNFQKAEHYFQEALKRLDRVTEREWLEIQHLYHRDMGRPQEALSYARLLVDTYPTVDWYRQTLADSLRALRGCGEAIQEYEQLLRLNPNDSGPLIDLATCYGNLGQRDRAVTYYEKFFALRPERETDLILNHEYGWTLITSGQEGRARSVFDKMLALGGTEKARGHRSFGLLALYRGQFKEGQRRLEEASRVNESIKGFNNAARDFFYLGEALILVGDTEAGVQQLDRAARWVNNQNFPVWLILQLSAAYSRAGRTGTASKLLDLGRTKVTDRGEFNLLLAEAELALSRQRSEQALEKLRRAQSPNRGLFVQLALARGLIRNGHMEEATVLYEKIVGQVSDSWDSHVEWVLAHRDLGRIYAASGQPDKARTMYLKFLDLWHDADPEITPVTEVREALKRLGE